MRKVLLVLFLLTSVLILNAQRDKTIDDPGDIVFLGVEAGTGFTFLLIDTFPNNTTIYFTNAEWNSVDMEFNSSGSTGIISWTNDTGNELFTGQIIQVDIQTTTANIGSVASVNSGFSIPNNNYRIYAMTGNDYVNYGVLLAAIGKNSSVLELTNTGLTLGIHAIFIAIPTGTPKTIVYSGPTTCNADLISCLEQFNNPDNWTSGGTYPPDIAPGDIVLPVQLIQFTGQAQNDRVKIQWATATEINNDYFQLERSKDGFDFRAIGRIKGKGTSTELNRYSFEDATPLQGLNYYRLAQYDIDGSMEYSDVIVVTMGQVSTGLSDFYPNPTTEGSVQVNYYSSEDTELVVRIQDMSGRVVQSLRRDLTHGNNTLLFDLKEQNSGVYVVTFEDERGIKKTRRLLIK